MNSAQVVMSSGEFWSFAASIVSVLLGVLAFVVSLVFFVLGKKSEQSVSNSLQKIEAQADALQKLAGRQLDRLTKYVTEPDPRPADDPRFEKLLAVLVQVAQPLASGAQVPARQGDEQLLRQQLVDIHIAAYYYAALANFWAQSQLPRAAEYDQANQFHATVRRVIDVGAADVAYLDGLLASTDEELVKESRLAHLLVETKNLWRGVVKSVADIWAEQAKTA